MLNLYLKLFGKARYYQFHEALFRFASQAKGIRNFTWDISGEEFFIKKILPKKSGMLVFDVGAFHGKYGELIKKYCSEAQIYAFEPQEKAFDVLQKRAKSLGIQAFPFGLGEKEEEKKLYANTTSHGSSLATLIPEVFENHYNVTYDSQMVSIKTIDRFCLERDIKQIDLLKIDVEGFEYEILQGAYKMIGTYSIDIIQFELNVMSTVFSRKLLSDFMALLPAYTFYRLLPKGLVKLHPCHTCESMDYQNIIAWRNDLIAELNRLPKKYYRPSLYD